MQVRNFVILVTVGIIIVIVTTTPISYFDYIQKSNLTNLVPNLEFSWNDINSTLLQENRQELNITNTLELILNQSITTKSKENGYSCIPVPSFFDPIGYNCEPCSLFPGLCPDISKFNKTIIN
jgi:predicted small secreted protein